MSIAKRALKAEQEWKRSLMLVIVNKPEIVNQGAECLGYFINRGKRRYCVLETD